MSANRQSDRQLIQEATYRHALGVDLGDPTLAVTAFTDDITWDATAFGISLVEGREAMLAFLRRDRIAMAEQFHVVTNHIIRFDGPDQATGTCYLVSEGRTKAGTPMRSAVWNEDIYRRVSESEWRIESRVVSLLTTPDVDGLDEF